jgi:hypothetical protein
VTFVCHNPVDLGKDREVLADADVIARVNFCADLTHQDVAGFDALAAETLYTPSLPGAVTAVF